MNMDAGDLIETLTTATDIPKTLLNDELILIIKKAGISIDELTIENLRPILVNYLQDVILNAKDFYNQSLD